VAGISRNYAEDFQRKDAKVLESLSGRLGGHRLVSASCQAAASRISIGQLCAFALLSTDFVAFGEDFFNAEDAKAGAEFRREHVSSATLFETLCGLGVESGGPAVWLRLGCAMPWR
jgi:hypothetical protein